MLVRIDNGDCAEWMVAHEALSRLARARAQAEFEEGKWLVAAFEAETHVHLGYGGFDEYIERLFGYSPRTTQEKLLPGSRLQNIPISSTSITSAPARTAGS